MKEMIKSILKEETEEIDQKVMNFLLRRYEINEINKEIEIEIDEIIELTNINNKITQ